MNTASVLRKSRYSKAVTEMKAVAEELRAAPRDNHGLLPVTGEAAAALADSLESWAGLIQAEETANQ